jgi:hypothetical protein
MKPINTHCEGKCRVIQLLKLQQVVPLYGFSGRGIPRAAFPIYLLIILCVVLTHLKYNRI